VLSRNATHDAHASAPVFVDVEAIDFDERVNGLGQQLKGTMVSERRRDEVDEWGLVCERGVAEEARAGEIA
jgi:hypothetical protein